MGWNGWPFTRVVIFFTVFGFTLVFIQVTLLHYRQNFRHWSQWVPVLALPILALCALLLTFYNISWIRFSFALLNILALGGGLYGFYMHLHGVGERVDGYRFHNFLVGPPIVMPLMSAAISTLGLLGLYWS